MKQKIGLQFSLQNSITLCVPILLLLQPGLEQNRRNDRIKIADILLFWLKV